MFLQISIRLEIPLKSILKSFVDTFVNFLNRKVIIISLCNENTVDNNSMKEKEKKKK